MPIDTKIEGAPDSVRATARWLRDTLATKIADTVDSLHGARSTARGDWEGLAGDAFSAKMTSGATKADGLETAAVDSAQAMDDYASEIQRAQTDMRLVREDAAAAGLSVDGFTIREPGPAPPDPGTPPTGSAVTPAAVTAYNAAVATWNLHTRLVAAYNTAWVDSETAREIEKLATETLNNARATLESKWLFVISDVINGAAGGLAALHSSTLLKQSKFLADESAKFLDLAKAAPPGTPAAVIYRDYDASRAFARGADDATKAAAEAKSGVRGLLGVKLGGALALGGVVYDVADGKDVDQAVVSGGVGFAASVAAGAAIGSFIPVPVAGTALGALGGATVGIFTSGAVDSLWENGVGNIGDVIGDGADAVVDTGKAIGGLAKGAWNAIF